ncbi:MAG: hypothetical protein ACRDUV_12635 [Pseudonocardiaceae bacterium]
MAMDTTTGATDDERISQAGPVTAASAPALAEVDLLIERPDFGPDCFTRDYYPLDTSRRPRLVTDDALSGRRS